MTGRRLFTFGIYFLCYLFVYAGSISGQDSAHAPSDQATDKKPAAVSAEGGAEALRKAAQNPIASLISVPLQSNTNFGIQPGSRTQDILNIQPVIPVGVSANWNVIVRWIMPIVWQPLPAEAPAPEVG